MNRSVIPAPVIAVLGMLFGMTLRYLVDDPLEDNLVSVRCEAVEPMPIRR